MAMFITDALIANPLAVVSAHLCTGSGALDGCYSIHVLLTINGKARELWAEYPTQAARDAAFVALGEAIREAHAEAEAPLTLDLDEED